MLSDYWGPPQSHGQPGNPVEIVECLAGTGDLGLVEAEAVPGDRRREGGRGPGQ